MNSQEIVKMTAHKAKECLEQGGITSKDLTTSILARIRQVEDRLKAFITVTEKEAIANAIDADSRMDGKQIGDLLGIPMQIKDNICTRGIVTTCASRMLGDFVPPYDATVVERMRRAGAVLVGKGNMDEFAMGSSTENSSFYSTKNPWDLEKVPGGSSGGPAAAVAAGECVVALGSDTGGSIRQPSALCGVVGLKPTYGLVSRYGLVAFASSLDQIGPITKDVHDSALVLNVIAGHDSKDSTSIKYNVPDYTASLKTDLKGMRIAWPKEYFVDGIEPGVESAVREAMEVLQDLGAEVEEISLPSTKHALAVYYIIAPSEASANLARYDGVKYGYATEDASGMWDALEKTRREGFGIEVRRRIMLGTYALSAGYYDAYYLKAQKVRTLITDEFKEAFNNFDVLVAPTSPTVAFNLGEKISDPLKMYLNDVLTIPANIAGIPAISVPGGNVDGLPVGLQFLAPHMGEELLFHVAYAYENATSWHKMYPKI
ncbi:MAG: Asp-tRNA(Asn)/Glu-tRNA(Gln) amidotransferase subunit GatA [Chloroflexota bacterium]|nr:Asp-tRNA(Asn)/Glu-tRNA(Gln) amidotransferase subunit GatA [Chloroflexota bacterium]